MGEIRLNKAIAEAGICSRRKADELILSGVVTVNGKPVKELGIKIVPGKDDVRVRGASLWGENTGAGAPSSSPLSTQKFYILLHKPVQVVSTASDPEGRSTVIDLLPPDLKKTRLYPVGRLDYFSEGLLLLTNDGTLTNRLTHPRYHLPKSYDVLLRETPPPAALERMRRGMTLAEGERLAPVEAAYDEKSRVLRLTLRQGVNRQIRRMCRDLDLTILRLRRTSLGPVLLGDLPKGACRSLTGQEIASLKKAAGL